MTVEQVLNSNAVLALISAVFGSIWAALRSTEWYQQAKSRRYGQAMDALEAGVELTYRNYVKAIKDAREDGKLTEDEMREARQQALDAAIEFGRTQGLDIARELGADYIDLLIAKLVKKLKA